MADNLHPVLAAEISSYADIAALAGGDIYDWARAEVQRDYEAARRRLGLTDPDTPTLQTGAPHP